VTTVGVFGGSFNPPHVAHVLAAAYVLAIGAVEEVLIVPVYQHPFSKELAPFDDRLAMCGLAFSVLHRVHVSDVERDLGGESLTLRTLEHLRELHPDWSLRLLVGSDVLPDLPKWHRWDLISEIAPPIVLDRAGATERPDRVLLPDVSSSEIRALFARGDRTALARLLPAAVLAYAASRGLYGAACDASSS
jgi:nicotinate-nucleotide adenylyltransferase